jgi:hypothetical protein
MECSMSKRKPVEAAEPASVVAEPKKKTVRSAAAAKPKSTATTIAHKHHTKNTTVESIEAPAFSASVSAIAKPTYDDVALLAYSYWETRGFQGGSPEQDWFRAESELLKLAQNR